MCVCCNDLRFSGFPRQVCLFLKRGATQNDEDEDGQDPLSIAVQQANADIVTLYVHFYTFNLSFNPFIFDGVNSPSFLSKTFLLLQKRLKVYMVCFIIIAMCGINK